MRGTAPGIVNIANSMMLVWSEIFEETICCLFPKPIPN